MKVFVNQDKKTYPEGTTIAEIVKKTNYNDKSYNVVRNGKLVKKEDYQNITIDENDKIRILPFAMGGWLLVNLPLIFFFNYTFSVFI